jgi:hypothetical protein
MNPDSIQVDVDEVEKQRVEDEEEESEEDFENLCYKEEDIIKFQNGIDLVKVYKKKKTYAKRNYRLDLAQHRIVASTKDWKRINEGAKYCKNI